MRLGAEGAIWVRVSSAVDAAERWAVHRPDGEVRGTVRLPEGVRLLEAGPDLIVGSFSDDLGVPYIGLWRVGDP